MDFGLEKVMSILDPLYGQWLCQYNLHLGVLGASQTLGQVLHKHLLQNPWKSAWKQWRSDPTLPQTFLLSSELGLLELLPLPGRCFPGSSSRSNDPAVDPPLQSRLSSGERSSGWKDWRQVRARKAINCSLMELQ